MGLFVNIKTVFPDTKRELNSLKNIYEDNEKLISHIDSVVGEHLTKGVIKDKKILLKPNWVRHSKTDDDEWCLRTHDNFLLAILEYILRLQPISVLIGDAPVQGCHWDEMITSDLINEVNNLSNRHGVPVTIEDFRRVHFDPDRNNELNEQQSLEKFVIFDVGKRSYLEPVTLKGTNNFRVTVYNPDRFHESHRPGV
ncbi:MAG: hypothetical protein KDC56_02320, partial [Flavobacteriaceae bacterium]|nr:hypothetical protein [Flavobacteriaceae bacterium]